jgi:hypothetical protein
METTLDSSLISVIVSGCVAVAAVVIPPLVSLVSEWLKWARENKAAEAGRFDQATMNLLKLITPFSTGSVSNAEAATQRDWTQLYADLRSKYYIWERVLWSHCKEDERVKLRELRAKIEAMNVQGLVRSASDLANEVLSLAHSLGERMS